jgi:phosphoglycerol geranylgeranyltransferase
MEGSSIYNQILSAKGKKKLLALLIDPDKTGVKKAIENVYQASQAKVDLILIGGSLVSDSSDEHIEELKKQCNIPILLFPGSLLQLSTKADAILLLSLISGRNPEMLIGNHVIAAPYIKKHKLQTIPVGYMLIESSNNTTVEYISNTKPIPGNKPDIAAATAIAGEMLGLKLIYLEAGSGAKNPVPESMIQEVSNNINIPLLVGGGIKNTEQLTRIYKSGADIAVIGNAIEEDPQTIFAFSHIRDQFNQ